MRLVFSSYILSHFLISRRQARASSPKQYFDASSPLKPPSYSRRSVSISSSCWRSGRTNRGNQTVHMCAHFRVDDLNVAPNGSGVELHIDRYTVKSRLQPVSFGINGGASIESEHSFDCSVLNQEVSSSQSRRDLNAWTRLLSIKARTRRYFTARNRR